MSNYTLLQWLIAFPLNGADIKVALCIFIKTKKYKKQTDKISLSQFEKYTGLSERSIRRSIQTLEKCQIIKKHTNNYIPEYEFILCKEPDNILLENKKTQTVTPRQIVYETPADSPPTLNTKYLSTFCIFIILIYICGFSFSGEEEKIWGRVRPTPLNVIRIGRLISFYFGAEQIKKIGKMGRMVSEDWKYLEDEFLLARIYVEHNAKFTHVTKTGLFILRTLLVHYGKDMVAWGIRETAKRTQYDPALIYLQKLLAQKSSEQ